MAIEQIQFSAVNEKIKWCLTDSCLECSINLPGTNHIQKEKQRGWSLAEKNCTLHSMFFSWTQRQIFPVANMSKYKVQYLHVHVKEKMVCCAMNSSISDILERFSWICTSLLLYLLPNCKNMALLFFKRYIL